MKSPINGLNKAFESRVKLGIMSTLVVNSWVEFNELKNFLQLTDGNLSSHLLGLEKIGFIKVKKEFVGKIPRTSYKITKLGQNEFQHHVDILEKLITINRGGK